MLMGASDVTVEEMEVWFGGGERCFEETVISGSDKVVRV